jgi:Bacterial mobilisation protein (MobC)
MQPHNTAAPVTPAVDFANADASAFKRSGSQKRQRGRCVAVWLTEEEYAEAETRAGQAGLSLSAFGRFGMLGTPGPRARRVPHVNEQALGRATTELNYYGNNLNQVAHVLNAGGAFDLARPYLETLADVRRTLHVIREAAAGRAADCHDNQRQPAR